MAESIESASTQSAVAPPAPTAARKGSGNSHMVGKLAGRSVSIPFLVRRPRIGQLAATVRQLASLIDAGIPITEGLDIAAREMSHPGLREALTTMRADIHQGASLEQAIGRHPRIFPRVVRQLVKVAETGGALDDVLEMLASYLEDEQDLNEQVRTAFAYPAAIGVIATLTVVALVVFVVPIFQSVFDKMGLTLPISTRMLILMAHVMRHYWWAVGAAVVAAFIGFQQFRSSDFGGRLWDSLVLHIPLIGHLSRTVAISRWVRACQVLISSGLPVDAAFAASADAANNTVIGDAIRNVCTGLHRGRDLATPLRESGAFPSVVVEMVRVGEESGALDALLGKCADYCDRDVRHRTKRIVVTLEPIMMLFVGGMIAFVAMSMYLPYFSLIASIK
ncbi:MAG: type II secretion system F family protein [Armatimonadota bacterium]